MPYRVDITRAAQRDLDNLPNPAFLALDPMIRALALNPRPPNSADLKGRQFRQHYRIRWVNYRAAYHIEDRLRIVTVKAVGLRGQIYSMLKRRA